MGAAAARNVLRTLAGAERKPFVYRDKGSLATIGRFRALASFGPVRLTGVVAWWFWLFVHLLYLVGFRNRINVMIEWGYSFFTYQRGARILS
jgi:NADH dehydrogenase